MTGDVAVHQPDTWIVCLESNHDETAAWEKNDITSWWVVKLQVESTWVVGLVLFLLENCKVMAVEVDLGVLVLEGCFMEWDAYWMSVGAGTEAFYRKDKVDLWRLVVMPEEH
jgi:hypothetical protein